MNCYELQNYYNMTGWLSDPLKEQMKIFAQENNMDFSMVHHLLEQKALKKMIDLSHIHKETYEMIHRIKTVSFD